MATLRARLAVPVELYDERYFRPRGWRRRARRCSSALHDYLRARDRERAGRRRRAGGGVAGRVLEASRHRRLPPCRCRRCCGSSSRRGFTRAQMVERVDAVRKIGVSKRKVTMRMTSISTTPRPPRPRPSGAVPRGRRRADRGLPLPGRTRSSRRQARATIRRSASSRHFEERGAGWTCATRARRTSRHADVLIIASMIRRRWCPRAKARRHDRPTTARWNAARHRRDPALRPGLHRPSRSRGTTCFAIAVQHTYPHGPTADADREPGASVDTGGAHPAKVDYLYFVRKPNCRNAATANCRVRGLHSQRAPVLVGLLGYPLTGSLSPRTENAAFAECGLDWSYALVPIRCLGHDPGPTGLGFAGANVTTPHKLAVPRVLRNRSAVGQYVDLRGRGRVEGRSTRPAILEELPASGR